MILCIYVWCAAAVAKKLQKVRVCVVPKMCSVWTMLRQSLLSLPVYLIAETAHV